MKNAAVIPKWIAAQGDPDLISALDPLALAQGVKGGILSISALLMLIMGAAE